MILLGSAGSSGLGGFEGVKNVHDVGLGAMEIEFTHGVNMSIEKAKEIGKIAKELGISLSVHGPYFINLATDEKPKLEASKKRIIDSCERAHYLGATHVVFHAGFYQKKSKEETYLIIKEGLIEIQEVLKKNNWNVLLAPETTGKNSQFGNLDELLRLNKELGTSICVDFAHLLARDGKVDYDIVLKKLKPIKHIHSHFSGIEYTNKGERRHLLTEDKDIKSLLSYLLKYKVDITIINESPNPLGDALKTKQILEKMK